MCVLCVRWLSVLDRVLERFVWHEVPQTGFKRFRTSKIGMKKPAEVPDEHDNVNSLEWQQLRMGVVKSLCCRRHRDCCTPLSQLLLSGD